MRGLRDGIYGVVRGMSEILFDSNVSNSTLMCPHKHGQLSINDPLESSFKYGGYKCVRLAPNQRIISEGLKGR